MEANICDIGNLDADSLLPPRKRILAGFKKHNSDNDTSSTPPGITTSSSSASSSPHSPPSRSEYQSRLDNLLASHLNKNHNLSPEQIVQASKSAADAALRAAEAARAAADEKAVLAARAMTAAKSALAFVAAFPEEGAAKVRNQKKNKLKKHVRLQLLYKKHQPVKNYRDDEKLARKLHRDINISPRILNNFPSSEWKGHKNKKLKTSPNSKRTRTSSGSTTGEFDSEDEKTTPLEIDSREAESPSKRRGRVKLKKLPLSICSSRDQVNPKDDIIPRSSPLTDKNTLGLFACNNKAMFSVEPCADDLVRIEVSSTRKCQELKSAACVKQHSKVVQS